MAPTTKTSVEPIEQLGVTQGDGAHVAVQAEATKTMIDRAEGQVKPQATVMQWRNNLCLEVLSGGKSQRNSKFRES
jgi:hypothetical protein